MNKHPYPKYAVIVLAVAGVIMIATAAFCFEAKVRDDQVCFNGQCVKVEVVSKPDEMSRGLQMRRSMPPDAGMLFIFPRMARHSFWMKDTLIPLDIIWLDHSRRVVFIHANTPPCRKAPCAVYTPPADALYVLELNAHRASALNIQEGNLLEFRLKGF